MIITIDSGLEKSTSPFFVVIVIIYCSYDDFVVRKQQTLPAGLGGGQSNALDTVPLFSPAGGVRQTVSAIHVPPLL